MITRSRVDKCDYSQRPGSFRGRPGAPLPPPHLALARAARERARPAVDELEVSDIRRLTPDSVAVTFAVPAGLAGAYRFRAGQHLTVLWDRLGAEIRRSYSICVPETSEQLTIAVKRLESGAFSTYANRELRVGARLRVMTPTGRFITAPDARRQARYVAVAAGSGITPILSMIATLLEREPASEISLLYLNRARASTMFFEDLERLARAHAGRLRVQHLWSRHPAPRQLVRGRLDRHNLWRILEDLEQGQSLGDIHEWLLCGPAELMDNISSLLLERGVQLSRIRRELFFDPHHDGADGTFQPEHIPSVMSEVTVRTGREVSTFTLSSRGESILSAAVRQGSDIPYSCQDGVCATCRAKVMIGQVIMTRCPGLDQREQQDGYVLACQAHPVTPRLLLDFDA